MTAQAFFYNAIFFTYALVLTDFYGVPGDHIGWYVLPFAAGNFLGPIVLGKLFDVIGRRRMIAFTYAISGVLLTISGYLFAHGMLTVTTQTIAWMVIFFFASAAASSAYLTVSETFPLEIRALAIAVFYAFGTALGGIIGPTLFGRLIDTHERGAVFAGYLIGSALMIAAGVVAGIWGVAAERKSLEDVARPLSRSRMGRSAAQKSRSDLASEPLSIQVHASLERLAPGAIERHLAERRPRRGAASRSCSVSSSVAVAIVTDRDHRDHLHVFRHGERFAECVESKPPIWCAARPERVRLKNQRHRGSARVVSRVRFTSPFGVTVFAVTQISTGTFAFQPWLNGTSVSNAFLNAASSRLRSNVTKRHGCRLHDEGAQRAASSTYATARASPARRNTARGLQRPASSSWISTSVGAIFSWCDFSAHA